MNRLRLRIISILFCVLGAILVVRLFYIQIIQGNDFRARADRQYESHGGSVFDRGGIFFSNSDGTESAAAVLKTGFTLSMNPKVLRNPEDAYLRISSIVPLEKDTFMKKASRTTDPYEELVKRVDPSLATRIELLDIPGITLTKEQWRYYPETSLASHLLGFVASDGTILRGRYGLEQYYDDVLRRDGGAHTVNFFASLFRDFGRIANPDVSEGTIVSTIEPAVQRFTETTLGELQKKWSPTNIGAIVMDPHTGEVIAMGALPTFDLNTFSKEKDPTVFSNPLVENVYEMGSIIKPLTIALGLDRGAIRPDVTYMDKGFVKVGDVTISDFDKKARGVTNMLEVLGHSLNTGAVFVEQQLGADRFSEGMLSFGLGEETGIDLPNEARGIVGSLTGKTPVGLATASFGQGIAMTPIATARALSILANAGVLPNPHVVKEIAYTDGGVKKTSPSPGERVLSASSTEEVTRFLVESVDSFLQTGKLSLPEYQVAAKTGTAQIAKPGGKGYYSDKFLHSFFGYFPAYNPRFLILLYMVDPKGEKFAGETLSPAFFDITQFLINYYEIEPDRTPHKNLFKSTK